MSTKLLLRIWNIARVMKKIMRRTYLDSLYIILGHRLEGWLKIGDEVVGGVKKN
jgi:hypothetical protein